ncbi:MAG: hypothetical protein KF680_04120 [Cryobacterium sp.]|nr:hypothetical protein [Cryobacterium sp.]
MSDSLAPAPTASGSTDRKTLLVVLVIVAVLVVAALVAVFARGGAQQFDPATPEGVVQTYATAVLEGDFDAARELHVASLSDAGCDPVAAHPSSSTRLTLVDTRVNGDNAVVTVNINSGYGGPFGGDSGYQEQFELTRQPSSGVWRISFAPWMFQVCTDQGVFK